MEENSGSLLTVKNNYGFYAKQFIRNKEYNKNYLRQNLNLNKRKKLLKVIIK